MMEIDPESRRILELAREARTPSDQDKARVERPLRARARLSAGAATVTAASAQAAGSLSAGKSAATAVVLKWWVAGGAWWRLPSRATRRFACDRPAAPRISPLRRQHARAGRSLRSRAKLVGPEQAPQRSWGQPRRPGTAEQRASPGGARRPRRG